MLQKQDPWHFTRRFPHSAYSNSNFLFLLCYTQEAPKAAVHLGIWLFLHFPFDTVTNGNTAEPSLFPLQRLDKSRQAES